jgi:hypothetical protein
MQVAAKFSFQKCHQHIRLVGQAGNVKAPEHPVDATIMPTCRSRDAARQPTLGHR